jgi:hypothetical protein
MMKTHMVKLCNFTAATILLSDLRNLLLLFPPPLERSTELKGRCHESDLFIKSINTYVRKMYQEGVHLLRVLSAVRSVSPMLVVTP